MSQRKIVIEPDPILRKKSETLEKVDDELRVLLDDMLDKKSPDSITNAVLGLYNNLGKEKLEELYLDDNQQ